MDRQTIGFEVDRQALIEQIEFDQDEIARQGPAWWIDVMVDDMAYVAQMLCGVKPYQWKAVK